MELLQFVFSSFWVWLGCVVLIVAAGEAVATAAAEGRPHTCQHCGQRVKIFCSVSYFCSPAEE